MGMNLGARLAQLRKARGMTQETLGKAVGVSAQAVSKWENGGAPDVALFPVIADTLGVTIDSLFGRQSEDVPDLEAVVRRWTASVPEEKRPKLAVRLLWNIMEVACTNDPMPPEIGCRKHCESTLLGGNTPILMRDIVAMDAGLFFGVYAEDLSFLSVFPEPEAGYGAYFAEPNRYRDLFQTLAQPGTLELLEHLYSGANRLYLSAVVAQQMGIPQAETETLMELLAQHNLLRRLELETEAGSVNAYRVHDNTALVPFLYMARCFLEKEDLFYMGLTMRSKPWLRRPAKGGQCEPVPEDLERDTP